MSLKSFFKNHEIVNNIHFFKVDYIQPKRKRDEYEEDNDADPDWNCNQEMTTTNPRDKDSDVYPILIRINMFYWNLAII